MGIEIEFKNISEHPRCANKINTGLRKDPSSGNTSLNLSLRDETKCEICYNGVEKGQYAYVMKCCDSLFHYKHAIRWFQRFSSCPYCRKSNVKKNYLMIIAS